MPKLPSHEPWRLILVHGQTVCYVARALSPLARKLLDSGGGGGERGGRTVWRYLVKITTEDGAPRRQEASNP